MFRSRLKKVDQEFEIIFAGQTLNPSSSIKYLGVHLDEHLTWKPYISELSTKLRRANGALSRIRHYVSQDIIIGIYHALFAFHLRYGFQFWANHESVFSRRILLPQKPAMRLISFSEPCSSSKPIFARLEILKAKVFDILFIHQYLNHAVSYTHLTLPTILLV